MQTNEAIEIVRKIQRQQLNVDDTDAYEALDTVLSELSAYRELEAAATKIELNDKVIIYFTSRNGIWKWDVHQDYQNYITGFDSPLAAYEAIKEQKV